MINVNYKDKQYTVEKGKSVVDFMKENLDLDFRSVIACKVNNEVKWLNHAMKEDCTLELIDYTTSDGNRVYVRGLTFIMTQAFEDVFPDKKIVVNYSLGHSIYCEDKSGESVTSEMIQKVKDRMDEIIEKDMPFVKSELGIEDAKKIYERSGRVDKIKLLETRHKDYVSVYSCGKTVNYFYGVMPISTGYMKYYDLSEYAKGFILIYPRRYKPTQIERLKDTKKLYATFDEYDKLHKFLNVQNISELNEWIAKDRIDELIRVSEALHEKKIAQIADMIATDKKKKLVLIAGPSSSGKTTFAQRLGVQLQVNGITSIALSMDNYFVNREDTPRDENGNYDFECIEAVDIPLFNEQLLALLDGKEVELPTFDFTDGTRKYLGNKVKLEENQVLIVEGIHGLNEKLTSAIQRENKFKIYISALTALNIDDYNRISTADSRMLRRILRDYQSRNHSPVATIKMWPSVRAGEEKHIFPFQEEADVMFNSSLVYEASVIKGFLEKELGKIGVDAPEYSEAKRLHEFLGYFLPIDAEKVPDNSILKEFIGGGCFYR